MGVNLFQYKTADAVSPTYNTDYIRNSTSGNGNIVSVTKHTHRYRSIRGCSSSAIIHSPDLKAFFVFKLHHWCPMMSRNATP